MTLISAGRTSVSCTGSAVMPGSNNVLASVGDLTSFLEDAKSPSKEETPSSEMQNKSWQVYSYFIRLAS